MVAVDGPKVAACIPTWRDGEALQRAVASVLGRVHAVILAPGPVGAGASSWERRNRATPESAELAWARGARGIVLLKRRPWGSLGAKRNAMLALAERMGCEWALHLDSDEVLEDPRRFLAGYLGASTDNVLPVRFRENGSARLAWWKLTRVGALRFLGNSFQVVDAMGREWDLSSPDGAGGWEELDELGHLESWVPALVHHPESRPPGRRLIRMGPSESGAPPLPRYPVGALSSTPMSTRSTSKRSSSKSSKSSSSSSSSSSKPDAKPATTEWYCPDCGLRYGKAGAICEGKEEAGHAPVKVKPVPVEDAA